MTRAIVIPADKTHPLRVVDHPSDDWKNMTALVFDGDREGGTYSLSIVGKGEKEVSLWYDDNGLARLDNEPLPDIINLRAMEIWAFCDGVKNITDFSVPLVGDYVVTGQADDDGNSMDAPAWVMDFPFKWHRKYVVTEKDSDD
jgi:hypothetical protein